jgi:hypothetical protein
MMPPAAVVVPPAALEANRRSDHIGGLPDNPVCVHCWPRRRRAMHCWGPGTGRDDHLCCIHHVAAGEPPDPWHEECQLADQVVVGALPASVVSVSLAGAPVDRATVLP